MGDTMSRNLTANEQASFDARVKAAYEMGGLLRATVNVADNIVGSTHRFHKMGKGLATRRIDQTDVIPMNITHGNATATLDDWNAAEYTGIFNQQKVPYKEQDRLATIIANAIGRREDQLIIDALDAAASTLVIDTNVGGAATGLNTAKCRRSRRLLNDQGVPKGKGDRTMLVSSEGLEQLLGDADANTFDKNVIKALYDGDIQHWVGFDFIEVESRAEGGLPRAALLRNCFAYHKEAIGLAVGINMRTEVNYIPHKTSYLANGIFSAGSIAIDALGIVDITTTEV
jgi:Phage capsid protein